MPYVYGCLDVQVTTTGGEGWGLTQLEGMACGIPQVVPQFAALAEWAAGAAYFVPCTERMAYPHINTIGSMPEREAFINALDLMYRKPEVRKRYGELALSRARNPRFTWNSVAEQFNVALKAMVQRKRVQVIKQNQEDFSDEKSQGENATGRDAVAAAC
jgi:glycosyltransferase involved in cell wall biosynthesis